MSFWDGLMRGMKDGEARDQRVAAADERRESREYSRSRDALSDERYAEAQDLAARSTSQANARAEAALAENTRRFDLGQERLAGQDDRAEAAEARAASTFEVARMKEFADMGFYGTAAAKSASSTGGVGSRSGSARGTGRTPTAQEMRDSVTNLTAELGGPEGMSSMTKADQDFYQTFLDVPSAAHGLRGFIQAQREEGNEITMEELPSLINLAGTVGGTGQEDYEAFAAKVAGGADLSDPKVFMEGLQAFKNFSPARVVWDQLNVAQPALNDQDAYGEWFSMLPGAARAAARELEAGDPRRVEIQRAHQKMLNTDPQVKEDGAFDLWDLGIGREQAKGLEGNPFMRAYFPAGTPQPVTPAAQPAMADPVTPVSEPSTSAMSFDTTEELDAWAIANPEQAANLNEVTVAGQVLTKGGNTTEVTPTLGTDTKASGDSAELISIVNNPNIGQDVKNMAMKEYSDTYGFTATREAVMESMRPGVSEAIADAKVLESEKADTLASLDALARSQPAGFGPLPGSENSNEVDTSMQDSQDLVAIMENPQVDPGMLQEAVRVFEEKYGVGSAEAAVEMIKKSQ